ncbi:hypothetical protein V5799_023150 [Amblyomma americanum]|uniref:Uncharacterized protein n=1 Tax=Amblyomma americanum TaxID=6943 RepID=A0AAQ4FIG8_AMBAM
MDTFHYETTVDVESTQRNEITTDASRSFGLKTKVAKLLFSNAMTHSHRIQQTYMSKRIRCMFCVLLFATWNVSNAAEAAEPSEATAAPDFVETTISSPQEAEYYLTPPPETTTPMSTEETTAYEDDPEHLERQHMEDGCFFQPHHLNTRLSECPGCLCLQFMNIEERIYVIKRNFNFKRTEKCESAQRLIKINEQDYLYTLRVRHHMFRNRLIANNVKFTISKTGIHKEYNAVTYQHGIDQPRVERKLMYISPEKTCAILVEKLGNGGKGKSKRSYFMKRERNGILGGIYISDSNWYTEEKKVNNCGGKELQNEAVIVLGSGKKKR